MKNRNIWILMSGEFIANLGLWIGTIGNLEFLQALVPSDFHKALILLLGMLSGVLVSPLAGKLIDGYSKKKIMLYSSAGRIVSVVFMFIAIWQDSILWMSVYMVGIGVANAFYLPAVQAAIPLIVKEHQLLSINGLHMNVGTVARIAGTALGGIALLYLSLPQMYALSMATYFIILCCTFYLRFPAQPKKDVIAKARKDKGKFNEIWPVLKQKPSVLMGLSLLFVPALFIGSFNLMVLEISELQGDPSIKSFLYTSEGIGFMFGAFFAKRIIGNRSPVSMMLFASIIMACSQLALYFAGYMVPSIIIFAVFGTAAGVFYPLAATLFQTEVERDMHGRFFSFRGMLDRILFQTVLVTAGLFLDTLGFQMMVLAFGAASVSVIIAFVWFLRKKQPGTPIHKSL